MPTIYVTVGLPGIGKSTYLADKLSDSFVYSTDTFIETKAAEAGKTYNDVWSPELMDEATKWMDEELARAIAESRNIIWDQTNMAAKKRRKILARVPKGYKKVCINFLSPSTPQEWAEHDRRLANRPGKLIAQGIIFSMFKSYVKPEREEGFDEVFHIPMRVKTGEVLL